jgi:hypothetical protein
VVLARLRAWRIGFLHARICRPKRRFFFNPSRHHFRCPRWYTNLHQLWLLCASDVVIATRLIHGFACATNQFASMPCAVVLLLDRLMRPFFFFCAEKTYRVLHRRAWPGQVLPKTDTSCSLCGAWPRHYKDGQSTRHRVGQPSRLNFNHLLHLQILHFGFNQPIVAIRSIINLEYS